MREKRRSPGVARAATRLPTRKRAPPCVSLSRPVSLFSLHHRTTPWTAGRRSEGRASAAGELVRGAAGRSADGGK
jgi:hypothetical protein